MEQRTVSNYSLNTKITIMKFYTVAGSDFDRVSNILFTFGPDSPTFDVQVNILDDPVLEATEVFSVSLSLPGRPIERVTLYPDNADVTILDNEGNIIIILLSTILLSIIFDSVYSVCDWIPRQSYYHQ